MPGAVRNADRKCKAKTNFAAYGKPNLGEYTAMHFASGRVRRKNRTYRVWGNIGLPKYFIKPHWGT